MIVQGGIALNISNNPQQIILSSDQESQGFVSFNELLSKIMATGDDAKLDKGISDNSEIVNQIVNRSNSTLFGKITSEDFSVSDEIIHSNDIHLETLTQAQELLTILLDSEKEPLEEDELFSEENMEALLNTLCQYESSYMFSESPIISENPIISEEIWNDNKGIANVFERLENMSLSEITDIKELITKSISNMGTIGDTFSNNDKLMNKGASKLTKNFSEENEESKTISQVIDESTKEISQLKNVIQSEGKEQNVEGERKEQMPLFDKVIASDNLEVGEESIINSIIEKFQLKEDSKKISEKITIEDSKDVPIKNLYSEDGTIHKNINNNLFSGKEIFNSTFVNPHHTEIKNLEEIYMVLNKGIGQGSNKQKSILTVRLSPEELGSVKIQLEVKEGIIKGSIMVDNEAAKNAMQSHLQDMKDQLKNQGLSIESLDISLDKQFNKEFSESAEDRNRYVLKEYGSTKLSKGQISKVINETYTLNTSRRLNILA